MVPFDFNRRRRSENGDHDAPDLGDDNHVLDNIRPNDNFLSVTSHHHGPPHRKILPHPSGVLDRLFRGEHSVDRSGVRPHHRPSRQTGPQTPTRANPTSTDRGWPSHVCVSHGCSRVDRDQTTSHGSDPWAGQRPVKGGPTQCVLVGSSVFLGGVRGGVYLHRAA